MMKKDLRFFFSVLIVVLVATGQLFAQRATYQFETRSATEGFNLLRSDASVLKFTHSVPTMSVVDFSDNGYNGQVLELNGIYLPATAGAPNLPANSRFVAMPNGANARLNVLSYSKQTISNVSILPAAAIPLSNDDSPAKYEEDPKIYTKNAFYPANPFQLSEKTVIRGVEVVMLSITPFQYNPVTKELVVYYDIEAEVVFEGGSNDVGTARLRNPWWDNILNDNILNNNIIPAIDYTKRAVETQQSKDPGCDYLIIVPTGAAFAQWADTIRVFRQHQGISTKVVNLTEVGGNTVAAIEAYVNNAYNNWTPAPAAILLLGDYSTNAADGIISHTLNDHPGGYNPYISDNPFADVTGDLLPDISFARITARNAAELQHMINKFLDYERTPPTNPNFYDHPVTAMGWQTERWFQICSETVNGFWEYGLGKNPVRENAIYSGTPGGAWSSNANTATVVNYFGPNGLNYIPANTAHLTDWGGNATRVNADINSGAFMLQHRDHGYEAGWGEPDYGNTNLPGLTNQDLTFVMSINCLTGKFNYSSECFAEKFHRHNYGALGLIAATEVSYSFVNDVYVWGAYDNMWPQFMPAFNANPAPRGILPAFSNAAGKYFLQQSSWPYNPEHKNITYNLFHHHGDAFMTVYSEIPQELTVSHMPVLLSGMDFFEVNANEGAMIALTVNDEIIGSAIAGAGPTSVPIAVQQPGINVRVTVTLQNYYRYEQVIECIPPSGPYIIYNAFTVNDANGNNNGQVDYNESILLDIAVKNVGSELAPSVQVVATSDDPYITLSTSSFTVGDVAAGATVTVEDALQFSVSDDVPDNHSISFTLTISSGSNEWASQFVVKAYAPAFTIGSMTIADPNGNNNGRLDPGETATLTISATNTGHSAALDASGLITAASPYITVESATASFAQIAANESVQAVYTIQVAGGVPMGSIADFTFDLQAGNYTASKNFTAKIGLIIEDFETGNFSQFGWTNGGNQPWSVVNAGAYAGTYAAKSGAINHNQNSQLLLQYEVGTNDSISFYYKVSSESGYDFLKFYIGTAVMGEWSGTVEWTKASYPVTAGLKTFKWEYSKDGSVVGGSDCAWIDDVILPPSINTTAWAGNDMGVCEGHTAQPNATASNYNSLNWTSSGTGTFNNPALLNPVYTPSEADYLAGNVTLTLTATGTTTIVDECVFSFNPAAEAFAGENHTICPGESYSIADATATNFSSLLWTTAGDGTFDNANALNPVYTPGAEDALAGNVTLTLTALPLGGCDAVSAQQTLSIYPTPVVEAGTDVAVCADGSPISTETAAAANFATLAWTSSGDGTFADASALATTYLPGTNDAANGNVVLYLTLTGEGNCMTVVDSLLVAIHDLPTAQLSPDQNICHGTAASLELTLTGQAPWTVMMNTTTEAIVVESSPYVFSMTPETTTDVAVTHVADAHCQATPDVHSLIVVANIPAQAAIPSGPEVWDLNDGLQTAFSIEAVAEAQTYEWTLNPANAGTLVANGTESTATWNTDFRGMAEITVRAANFCGNGDWSVVKAVEVKSTIGINENQQMSLHLVPNPANNTCTISWPHSLPQAAKLMVSDLSGKLVFEQMIDQAQKNSSIVLNVSQFDKGAYMVTITDGSTTFRQKLIRN